MNFDLAFNQMIDVEKGYVNHPADRGGPTKYGITLKTLAKWRNREVTAEDVKNLTLNEAKLIYKSWYWNAVKGDSLRSYAIAYALFDQAVNRGADTAIRRAQKIAGVSQDGKIGPQTINALNAFDEKKFIKLWAEESIASYGRLIASDPSQEVFRNGWENRVKDLVKYLDSVSGKTTVGIGAFIITGLIFFLVLNYRGKA
jgi:lysozyme family protein